MLPKAGPIRWNRGDQWNLGGIRLEVIRAENSLKQANTQRDDSEADEKGPEARDRAISKRLRRDGASRQRRGFDNINVGLPVMAINISLPRLAQECRISGCQISSLHAEVS